MRHYVGYHKPQRMGYTAAEITSMGLYTNKDVGVEMVGNVVWLITGEGKNPKVYSLCYWFVVESVVRPANRNDFGSTLRGESVCGELDPPVQLNEYAWFPDFLKGMGNFGLGLQPITNGKTFKNADDVIAEFIRLAGNPTCLTSA